MKTKIGMLCAGAFLVASCTGQEAWQTGEDVIRLGASTQTGTRSVEGLDYLSTLGAQVGIYGAATLNDVAETPLEAEWTETPLMPNICTTGIDATSGAISWADTYNYPQETGMRVKFCAYQPYAPVGTEGENYVSVAGGRAPTFHFTLTGGEDVMIAEPVLGSRAQPASTLNFSHVLTQFSFRLVNADGFFDKRIAGITFKGVNTRSAMNLETGALGEWDAPEDGIEVAQFDPAERVTGTIESPQKVGRQVMLQPGQASFVLAISFGDGSESEVTIRPQGDAAFEAGKSYLITLRFSGKVELLASASVTPWGAGAYGGGILD